MSEMGLSAAWCVLQVTLLASAVSLCYLAFRRSRPGFRSSVAATGVFVVLVLSVLSVSPYPNWTPLLGASRGASDSRPDRVQGISRSRQLARSGADARDLVAATRNGSDTGLPTSGDSTGELTRAETRGSPRLEAFSTTRERIDAFVAGAQSVVAWLRGWLARHSAWLLFWGRLFGVVLLCGIGWNLLQLFHGWLSLRRFRSRATPVESSVLQEHLDVVQATLGFNSRIELCETSEMTSPATVGWWRPVVILPADWREWSDDECRGVLAHEVAHVQRKDYLTGLLSQLVLSLHFYHPLINWLISRLQLDQELAADAAAVRVLGSNKAYLKLLAAMALKDHHSAVPHSARTFFPQRATLMARVEMLRGNAVEPGDGSVSWRTGVRGVLVCLGLALAGLRPLVGADATPDGVLSAGFIPESSVAAAVWRPAAVPETHPLARWLADLSGVLDCEGLGDLGQIHQISLFWLESVSRSGAVSSLPHPSGVVLSCSSPRSRQVIQEALTQLRSRHPERRVLGGLAIGDLLLGEAGDSDLVIAGTPRALELALEAQPTRDSQPAWCQLWNEAGPAELRIMFRPSRLNRVWKPEGEFTQPLGEAIATLADWQESVDFALGSFRLGRERCQLQVVPVRGVNPETLRQPVQALLDDWRNRLGNGDDPATRWESLSVDELLEQFDPVQGNVSCREILEVGRLDSAGSLLNLELPISGLLGLVFDLPSAPGEAVAAENWNGRHVAQFDQSMSFLLDALLAYRRDHGSLPSAAVQRNPGEPLHSWRVALLPYLGRKDLSDAYHFDKSWNSPENLRLLSQIPDVYRGFGSLTDAAQFCLGTSLGDDATRALLDDWSEVSEIVLVGSAEIRIPWTCPDEGSHLGQLGNTIDNSAGVAAAELSDGRLEQHRLYERGLSLE